MADDIELLVDESQLIITAWEQMGVPGGRAEDNLRIIREHLSKLAEVSKARPTLAGEVEALASRYAAMAVRIRMRSN